MLNVFMMLGMPSVPGWILFFYVQENAYSRPNVLAGVNDLLHGQTFATTFFIVLFALSIVGALTCACTIRFRFWLVATVVVPIIIPCLNTYLEYVQYSHPTYHDNYILDVVVGWIAYACYYTAIMHAAKRQKY